ncbi:MAG: hybrid-cluster NAD(P)-dependent oxidoreductase [Gammaproteobacteria bacterium]|nr:hybrid-cluster NAD(P)-dependent oxidoreductase [Gammaproteobacteria bacterium]
MTTDTNLHINIFELPFLIYIAIVNNKQGLSTDETENYIFAINDIAWPKSNTIKNILSNAHNEYSHSWKKYQANEFTAPIQGLQIIHHFILKDLNKSEIEEYINDVLKLVDNLFDAHESLFSKPSETRARIRDLVKSIFLETTYNPPVIKSPETSAEKTSEVSDKPNNTTETASKLTASAKTVSVEKIWPLAAITPENVMNGNVSFWNKGKLQLRCIEIIDETHDVKTFKFINHSQTQLFLYKPGQFISIELMIEDKKILRSYTISSTPSRPHTLSITVKRVPGGEVSNWLHDFFNVGDIINARGPNGDFTCFDHPAQKMLLISGGSGITPVMSMMKWLADTSSEVDIVFLHNARTPHDIIFAKELDLISAMHSNIEVVVAVSEKSSDGWQGFTGRISPQMIEMIAPDFAERTVYVCGPNEYMEATQDILEWMKFPMENYYSESFGGAPITRQSNNTSSNYQPSTYQAKDNPSDLSIKQTQNKTDVPKVAKPQSNASSQENKLIFKQSNKEVSHNGSDYILDIAEDNLVEIASACLQGSCGTCRVRKLEGEVDMASSYLSDEEVKEGYILACCSVPLGKVVIEA